MKNTLRTLLAFTSIAFIGTAVPAFASDSEPLHVSVPFAFKAGKTMLPAGDYTVSSDDSRVIMIKGNKGSAILLGSAGAEGTGEKSGVSFERDASGYCLKSVFSAGKTASTRVLDAPSGSDDK